MTYQFKIQLENIDHPKVWRRINVPGHFNFSDLHYVIQSVFGWENAHLYQFSPKGFGSEPQIGNNDMDNDTLDAERMPLSRIFKRPRDKFVYIYDFGDSWTHLIELEKIGDDDIITWHCTGGEGTCPPEDCGGPWGYAELKQIMSDKNHPEYAEMRDWLGLDEGETWDANRFNPNDVERDDFSGDTLGNSFGFPNPPTYNEVEVIPEIVTPTEQAPVFTHPEIEALYRYGSEIDRELLYKILELPRETLVKDLEKVVMDCMERCDHFYELDWDDRTHSFPLHALMLLSVLQAEESLPTFFILLRQSEELLDYWFSDLLTEDLWRYASAMGQNRFGDFKKFLLEPNRYTFARTVLSEAVLQIAINQDNRKDEAIAWFEDMIRALAAKKDDKDVFDTSLFSSLVSDLIDIGGLEQLPFIEQCYEQGLVSEFDAGSLKEARTDILKPVPKYHRFKIFTTVDQFYDDWSNWSNRYNSLDDSLIKSNNNNNNFRYSDKPYIAPPKVGRNDPCPCGSGKKYKKCCGAN